MPDNSKFDRTERVLSFLGAFFTLRPMFTLRGLRFVFFGYVVYEGLHFVSALYSLHYTYSGNFPFRDWLGVVPLLLLPLIKIGIVRILMEVAVVFLSRHSEAFRSAN
jgi:hypothetical protein